MSTPYQKHSPTSQAAAQSMEPHEKTLKEQVLKEFLDPHVRRDGLTDEELINIMALSPNTVRPRRIELTAAGLLEGVGFRAGESGRKAVVWRYKEPSLFS